MVQSITPEGGGPLPHFLQAGPDKLEMFGGLPLE